MNRQAILDALPAEVVVLDRAGRIVAVNDAWRRFAEQNGASPALCDGVGLDYVAACRCLEGEDAEEADALADDLTALLAGGLPELAREYPCDAPDCPRWFALRAAPLKRPDGGAVVVHLDITERKLAEQAARRARENAAQAARLNAVGVLATSLLHELSQPLSAAGFFSGTAVSLLEQSAADPTTLCRALHGIDEQIQQAAAILQRLRDFLRRREMDVQAVAIDDIVAQAMGLARWFAADRLVQIRYVRPAPGVMVMADAMQITQVLVNLVSNAVQAIDGAESPRREVEIAVNLQPKVLEVGVRDTGPGLPTGIHAGQFDIFSNTKDAGLGLGLAISRDIVEAHAGKLWADPNVPEGAHIQFTLPLAAIGENA
jgi:two-component system, LuxR family, sensor kinase FixL